MIATYHAVLTIVLVMFFKRRGWRRSDRTSCDRLPGLIMQAFTCIIKPVSGSMDLVFKALADPHRRQLLDSLRQRDGQTLGQLCMQLDMARQSATQHLALLEAANLISTVWRGREKLHYLNRVPIYEIQERWIENFELPRLRTIRGIKQRAEENDMTSRTFVYVTYIQSTTEKVWHALTDADLTGEYWGHRNVSDWRVNSRWEHQRTDGSGIADVVGNILESDPPRRLVMTFEAPGETLPHDRSTVTFSIEPFHDIVRLTVTHEDLTDEGLESVSLGWPAVFANLKSLLETGHVLSQAPWEMPADPRVSQMARNDARS